MKIKKLKFFDNDFKLLVNAYLKVLIYSIIIDWNLNKKELKVLFSLLTRVDVDNDNFSLWKINYIPEDYLEPNILNIENWHFDYIRVLSLENMIFYEWEKSLPYIFQYLEKKNKLSFEEKMEVLDKNLKDLNKIMNLKLNVLWKEYIKLFNYWLYFYVELIAKQAWKIFGSNIVIEEEKYLEKIKTELNIEFNISKTEILKLRTPILKL